jgi:hypothetical protein
MTPEKENDMTLMTETNTRGTARDMADTARMTAEQAKDMVSEGAAAVADGTRDLARDARRKAIESSDRVAGTSRETMETASARLKASARDAASALSDAAGELSHVVGDEVSRRAGEMRDVIADQGTRLTENLHDMAERHDLASLPTRAVDTAVSAVSSAADRVSNQSFSALLDDAADFARRRPVATAVGVAAAAFVVMRLIRASASDAPAAKRQAGAMRAAAAPNQDRPGKRTSPKQEPAAKTSRASAARKPAGGRSAASPRA